MRDLEGGQEEGEEEGEEKRMFRDGEGVRKAGVGMMTCWGDGDGDDMVGGGRWGGTGVESGGWGGSI